ncbi:hypothetical protein EDD85DRAFT_782931 [Armillaria nabsnona]|nr:hypothetical protein EDD85DRAFT_782931 [Armillaria nabsnona]
MSFISYPLLLTDCIFIADLCLRAEEYDSDVWSDDEEDEENTSDKTGRYRYQADEDEDKDEVNDTDKSDDEDKDKGLDDDDDTRGGSALKVYSGSDIQVSFRDAYGGALALKAQPDNRIATHVAAYASEFCKDKSIKFKFLTIKSLDKRILLPRSMLGTYGEAIDAIATHFPKLKKETLLLRTIAFPECEGEYVEIPPTTWTHALPELTSVDIEIEAKSDAIKQYPIIQMVAPPGTKFEMSVQRDLAQDWMFHVAMKRRRVPLARKCGPQHYRY